jgi:serine/threonine protein kinase
MGVATEVDAAEAFYPLYVLRRAIWGLFGLLSACSLAMLVGMVFLARQQRRVEKAERTIKQLGQYSLDEKIGSGGMGSVYRAHHAFLRRPTAVKMLEAKQAGAEGFARFEREVQITARLTHPNTIAVYDYGRTPEGVFYYAMELLDGINLEELVNEFGPLPEGRVINILQQVCGSLFEAHESGLIHRDIKPANIILSQRAGIADFVKVLDFGLVKAVDTAEDARITMANVTVGTPNYISPEAVDRPDLVSAKSDLYAIGAVGYFLLTGTPVFSGKTVMDICMKHVRAIPEPPSKRLGSEICPPLEALILRCLAKAPADRPASARVIIEELSLCQPAQPWTRANAENWWRTFRKSSKQNSGTPETLSAGVTAKVQ